MKAVDNVRYGRLMWVFCNLESCIIVQGGPDPGGDEVEPSIGKFNVSSSLCGRRVTPVGAI